MSDEKKINGIICHADNCEFHSTDDCCHAGCIKVTSGCDKNSCSAEPLCDTFKAKF